MKYWIELLKAERQRMRGHAGSMSHVKLGAGTYAIRDVDVFEALPRLRQIGVRGH